MKYLKWIPLFATVLVAAILLSQRSRPLSAAVARPNIIIILTDDQDVESLPVMRNLMSYPEGSWVNFTNAFINDSICCSSRATILTGQYDHNNGVMKNNQGRVLDDDNTLPVWLDDAGYNTALIGKYLNGFPWKLGATYVPPGWDSFRGPRSFTVTDVDTFTGLAVEFIQQTDAPFFLYLAYMAPHWPAEPPLRYRNALVYVPQPHPNVNEADVSDKPLWVRSRPLLTSSTLQLWRREQLNSQRELLAVDDGVQAIVDALKAKGQLNNTIMVYLGDNGLSWGSHRKIGKWCPYEECSRVPFLVRYPGVQGNRAEDSFVSNVDIASTLAAYAGVQPTIRQDGRSLLPLLTNPNAAWTDEILLERHVGARYYGIRIPGWKYVEYNTREEELYDLTADPFEMESLANKPQAMARQIQMAGRLHRLLGQYGISGFVRDGNGQALENVTVTVSGGFRDKTNSSGWYSIRELKPGPYTITLSKFGYTFSPPNARFTINGADVVQDFTASQN